MTTLSPPAGNPLALAASVDRYEATELAIANAADELLRVVMDGESASIDALNQRASTATGHLIQAHGRYQGTRSALRSYTVDLENFHAVTTAAIEQEHSALGLAFHADQDLADATRHARSAALNPQDQATIHHWQVQVRLAHNRVDAAQSAIAEAGADYFQAVDALDQAAHRTIALIETSFDGTNDGRMDGLKHAIAAVSSIASNLANWAADFFAATLALVVKAVEAFIVAVQFATAVLALSRALALAVIIAVPLIINFAVGLLASVLALILVGVGAHDLATSLGVDDLTHIRIVLGALAVASPALGYFLVNRITGEVLKPAPKVAALDPTSLDDPATLEPTAAEKTLAELQHNEPDSVDDFLWQAGAVDTIGGSSQTVVDIARIVHEDGSVAWIVTLPSTKDWVLRSDQGATNDLDADLLLLAFPELKTQYERAVLDAMAQAGIGEGEPVLLTGWSLGGILAGHLAEKGAGGHSYAGLVVAGSPIDHIPIASDIPVIQVKHTTDPVHRGDMIDTIPDAGGHISLWDGPRSGIGLGLKTEMMGHNAVQYRETLAQHVTYDESINDDFREFYVVDDPNHTGKPRIEHTQYAFSE